MIPKIKLNTLRSVSAYMVGPRADPDWVTKQLEKLSVDNPVIHDVILQSMDKFGPEAATTGLVIYVIIESQMTADALTKLIGD